MEIWCGVVILEDQAMIAHMMLLRRPNGDFVLVGASESQDVDISDPRGSYDAWIVKLNAAGDLLWERSFGGSGYDSAKAIIENRNGDYVILGQTYSA